MQLVVPMAGLGQRFADAGYAFPKPLIPVDGIPMFVRAARELPAADRIVFVIHPEHARQHQLASVIEHYFPGSPIVVTPGLTRGQACTVRLACDHLDPDQSVLVAACDNSHLYSAEKFEQQSSHNAADCLIWTYRHDLRVLAKPTAHGWVRVDSSERNVTGVSCKTPISDQPLNDHAISGCFWFRQAGVMRDAIDAAVAANDTVNNEFYLDTIPNRLLSDGRRVEVFEVDKYIGWGTPLDLEDYERWERYFSANRVNS